MEHVCLMGEKGAFTQVDVRSACIGLRSAPPMAPLPATIRVANGGRSPMGFSM